MASISPSELNTVLEGRSVNVTFNGVMGANEVLQDITITSHRSNDGITVSGSNYQGQYRDSFNLGANSIKYRDRLTNETKAVSRFGDLPEPTQAHVYEFNAPSTLETDYTYTVTLNYQIVVVDPISGTSTTTDHTLVETITQTVRGTWDKWANELVQVIQASGE